MSKQEISYEDIRKVISSSQWPRSLETFPRTIETNCVGFALDLPEFNLGSVIGNSYYDDVDAATNLISFFKEVGLSPRQINNPSEKKPDEYVIIVYKYTYYGFDSFQNCVFPHCEVHLARIELDGTLVEKPSYVEPVQINTLENLNNLIAADAVDDEHYTGPTFIAIRKPQ